MLVIFILAVIYNRRKLATALRVFRDLRTGAELMRQLPGPGKELEHPVLGHMGGPLIIEPGQSFEPEYFVNNLIIKLRPLYMKYRKDGLFRREFIHCKVFRY